jgi:hypothetical protein
LTAGIEVRSRIAVQGGTIQTAAPVAIRTPAQTANHAT